ncbi:MAG: M48 family metallopeptidase [Leadbetterella sp.]|nr:M48 family metallopeptidase [Leadbetterella sp.]
MSIIKVGDLEVEVVKKDIKNIHLGVYPPIGRVRLSAPASSDDEKIRLFIVSKIPWIRKNQRKFKDKERLTHPNFTSRESHYISGRRYLLEVDVNGMNKNQVTLAKNKIKLNIKEPYTSEKRREIFESWLRRNLRYRIEPILSKWEKLMSLHCSEWKIKKMKTKWGSCNEEAKRLWFNLELMKVDDSCLEYVIVHELAHLKHKHHNKHFFNTLSTFIPDWEHRKNILNQTLLVY